MYPGLQKSTPGFKGRTSALKATLPTFTMPKETVSLQAAAARSTCPQALSFHTGSACPFSQFRGISPWEQKNGVRMLNSLKFSSHLSFWS